MTDDPTRNRPPAFPAELLNTPRPRGMLTPADVTEIHAGAEAQADRDFFESIKFLHDRMKSVLALLDEGNAPRARAELQSAVELAGSDQISGVRMMTDKHAAAVNQLLDLIGTLHDRMQSAVGLLDAGKVTEARALLDAQVVALDRLNLDRV